MVTLCNESSGERPLERGESHHECLKDGQVASEGDSRHFLLRNEIAENAVRLTVNFNKMGFCRAAVLPRSSNRPPELALVNGNDLTARKTGGNFQTKGIAESTLGGGRKHCSVTASLSDRLYT